MRVKIREITKGPGPEEAVVGIKTSSNQEEEVVVQQSQIEGGLLKVWPIGTRDDSVLVELPQESASGNWRLWIDRREVA
jgi:dCTP deaminase